MSDDLIKEVCDRLDGDELTESQKELVYQALFPDVRNSDDSTARQSKSGLGRLRRESRPCFLNSIRVRAFRGIGQECELLLKPNPGLTLVGGRNGSGKSSLVEGAEFALTGTSKRWDDHSAEWKTGWRNVHRQELPQVEVELTIAGQAGTHTISARWTDDDVGTVERSVSSGNGPTRNIATLGWQDAIIARRPILSYAELAQIIERGPGERYEAIAPILGMQQIQEPLEYLGKLRLAAKKLRDTGKQRVGDLTSALDALDDERAQRAKDALSGTWDIAVLEEIVSGVDEASALHDALLRDLERLSLPEEARVIQAAEDLETAIRVLEGFGGSDVERSGLLADSLETAIRLHQDHGEVDCPVCGQGAVLQEQVVETMREEVKRLRTEAAALGEAKRELRLAREEIVAIVKSTPEVLAQAQERLPGREFSEADDAWRSWCELPNHDAEIPAHLLSRYEGVEQASARVRERARELRLERESAWRPISLRLSEALPLLREAQQAIDSFSNYREAEQWLQQCEQFIRNKRFQIVADKVKSVWNRIAEGSNVTLEEIVLAPVSGTARAKVKMTVTVDGEPSEALGVMSQGELMALALSFFIPRVSAGGTPFGFVLIDDPVQSMDPIRVDQLASILGELAEKRQVVVFTHDDRLTAAVRRRNIPADVRQMTRGVNSRVEVAPRCDPTSTAIGDARALILDEDVPAEIARRVVPGLCRQALEASCRDPAWQRMLKNDMNLEECEVAWTRANTLKAKLALALRDDLNPHVDVMREIAERFGLQLAAIVDKCNQFTHTGADDELDLENFISDAEALCEQLKALT